MGGKRGWSWGTWVRGRNMLNRVSEVLEELREKKIVKEEVMNLRGSWGSTGGVEGGRGEI